MSVKKSVCIVGGLGYVGDPLIALLRNDFQVTVVDPNWFDNTKRYEDVKYIEKSSFEINEVDSEFCVYLAAVSNDPMGQRFKDDTYKINELEAIRLANICAQNPNSTKFIFASSCSVYGATGSLARKETDDVAPLTDYAKSKIKAEAALEVIANEKLAICCLRFATACGVSSSTRLDLALNDFVITALSQKKIEVLSDGMPWRPFIHVKDMALAIHHAITGPTENFYEVYNVGSNEMTFRIRDLAEAIGNQTNAKVEILSQNPTDSRSYTVNFDKFTNWYSGEWPSMDLGLVIEELKDFYMKNVDTFGIEHFNNFRESEIYCRLRKLEKKTSNNDLKLS